MKKVLLIAAVAGLAMVSCKKKYTCECSTNVKTYVDGAVISNVSSTSSGEFADKMTKKDAKKKCEDGNGTTRIGDSEDAIETTISGCSIK